MEELPNPKLGDKGYMVDMRADATNCPPVGVKGGWRADESTKTRSGAELR